MLWVTATYIATEHGKDERYGLSYIGCGMSSSECLLSRELCGMDSW